MAFAAGTTRVCPHVEQISKCVYVIRRVTELAHVENHRQVGGGFPLFAAAAYVSAVSGCKLRSELFSESSPSLCPRGLCTQPILTTSDVKDIQEAAFLWRGHASYF